MNTSGLDRDWMNDMNASPGISQLPVMFRGRMAWIAAGRSCAAEAKNGNKHRGGATQPGEAGTDERGGVFEGRLGEAHGLGNALGQGILRRWLCWSRRRTLAVLLGPDKDIVKREAQAHHGCGGGTGGQGVLVLPVQGGANDPTQNSRVSITGLEVNRQR